MTRSLFVESLNTNTSTLCWFAVTNRAHGWTGGGSESPLYLCHQGAQVGTVRRVPTEPEKSLPAGDVLSTSFCLESNRPPGPVPSLLFPLPPPQFALSRRCSGASIWFPVFLLSGVNQAIVHCEWIHSLMKSAKPTFSLVFSAVVEESGTEWAGCGMRGDIFLPLSR